MPTEPPRTAPAPPDRPLGARLAVALQAAWQAGRLVLAVRAQATNGHVPPDHKGRVDLVTEADRGAERLLVDALRSAFPEDAVLGEEGGSVGPAEADYRWVLDPVDGTTNYVHGLDHFAVSVGLARGDRPVLGVVHAPALARTWAAADGLGCRQWRHVREAGERPVRWQTGAPARVSETSDLGGALLVTGFPYDRQETAPELLEAVQRALRLARGVRRFGAASLDFAQVASGELDAYWEPRLKPWDMAAGAVLVREAGGRVTAGDGAAFDLTAPSVVASNGRVHEAVRRHVVAGESYA